MKLCYWTNYPSRYQTFFFNALRDAGIDLVVIYFTTYDGYRKTLGWKERSELQPWELRASSVHEAKKAVPDFGQRVQVCTGFFGRAYWDVVCYCILRRLVWCACTEGSRGGWTTWPVRVIFARLVDRFGLGVFAIGRVACGQYAQWGVRRTKIAWHSHSTPAPSDVPCRSVSGTGAKGCTFVFCGALTRRKGVDVLLKAFAEVHARCPSSVLRLVGDGPWRSRCASFARDRFGGATLTRRSSPLVLVGAVEPGAVEGELLKGDVVVLPSRYDAWGVALAEGAALGLAMIGSDRTGAAADLIEDGVNGFRVAAGSVASLARAMLRYAEQSGLALEHGAKAREAAERTFAEVRARAFVRQLEEWRLGDG